MRLNSSLLLMRQQKQGATVPCRVHWLRLGGLLCCAALIGMATTNGFAVKYALTDQPRERSVAMGHDYHLCLFNLKTYREKVLPAYRLFLEKDDPSQLIGLLNETKGRADSLANLPGPSLRSQRSYEEDIGILTGSVYYNTQGDYTSTRQESKTTRADMRYFVKTSAGPDVLLALCVPRDRGLNPMQNMGRSLLVPYLYEKSEWIESLFTSLRKVRGGQLEILIGDSPSEIFTREDIREFSAEVAKVSPPIDSERLEEYNNLQALLELTAEDPDLTLILTVN